MSVYGIAGSAASSPILSKKLVQPEGIEDRSQPSLLASPSNPATSPESQIREQVLPLLIQTIVTLLTQFLSQHQQPPTVPPIIPGIPPVGMNEISGAQGPFDLATPGAFGANAALNQQQLNRTNPLLAANSSVRFSPEGQPKVNDAFGFALEDVRRLDKNGDLAINASELTAASGNPFLAQQYLTVLDRNKDNKIDVVEAAGLLLAQDGANSLFAGIVNPNLDPGPNANADGKVTPQEFALANRAITSFPSLATETLDQLQSNLDLRNRFEQFKGNIDKLVPPASTQPNTAIDFSVLPDISQQFVLPKTIRKDFLNQFQDLFALINSSLVKK